MKKQAWHKVFFALWIAGGACFALPASVLACPGCKEAAFETPESARQKNATARAFAISIGLLLAVPFTLVGGIAFLVIRSRSSSLTTPEGSG